MKQIDLVVIGGGPAGMAAAVSAYENGIKDILILAINIRVVTSMKIASPR